MNIFYDLETTGIETKHQILSACFVKTDSNFNIKEIKNFNVALNPLEIPAESAIITNSVDITKHMIEHENKFDDLLTEEEFARKLNSYLNQTLGRGFNLIGYNSNKFDIKHLRKVLIKWGFNPYYNYNKFGMVDLFNNIRYLKALKPDMFKDIENLKLGTVYKHLTKKEAKGQHEAESDVVNCVELAVLLKEKYNWDIVKNNDKTNNIFDLTLDEGDIVALVNPYGKTSTVSKYVVHDINNSYILLENQKIDAESPDEAVKFPFYLASKNDFIIAKKIGKSNKTKFTCLQDYFDSTPSNGVENFIYSIKFPDFKRLEQIRESNTFNVPDSMSSDFDQIKCSMVFTRSRPIKHTTDGLSYESDMTLNEKKFFIKYYEKYLKDEVDKRSENTPELKILRDYREAYAELYNVIKEEL